MIRAAFALSLLWSSCAVAQGDPTRGEHIYKRCASCHMVGANAESRSGPPLNNIIGAPAGRVAGYRYSKPLVEAAHNGLHWNDASLDAFLADPKGFLPRTRMSFRGLKTEQDRTDVIAYLATFSGASLAEVADEGFQVSDAVLAIEGDVAWGEYLSSECTTCHQVSGGNDGIASITGWDTAPFVTAMHAYREKYRENPVMQLVAGRLSDDEIAALAAYFEGID